MMLKKLGLLAATMALIALGVTMFAAFESHLIDVRAHVEKATYTKPNDLDFGVTIMEQKYDAACRVATDPTNANGDCMSIHLSESFLKQTDFFDVTYKIYCEDKAPGDPHRADGNITPYIRLQDSDPADANDGVTLTNGCGTTAYSTDPKTLHPVAWAFGELDQGFDEVDLWDMSFFAPLCWDNWNPETDPIDLRTYPGGGLIDPALCHKGPGPDSDEYVDLASNVKFQVTGLSVLTAECVNGNTNSTTLNDICVDGDGIATAGPGAFTIAVGDPVLSASAAGNPAGLDLIDRGAQDGLYQFGDDLMVEDPTGTPTCPTASRNAVYDASTFSKDCVVLDPDGSLADGDLVTCDTGAGCGLWFRDDDGDGRYDVGEDLIVDVNGNGVFD